MAAASWDLDALILQIHAAPAAAEGWRSALESLQRLVQAPRTLLHCTPPRSPREFWQVNSGFDDAVLQKYAAEWATRDEWALGAHRRGLTGTGVVTRDDDLVERGAFMRSAFFNDFLKSCDIDRHLSICLAQPGGAGGAHVILGLYRTVGAEAFTSDEAGVLKRLAPHLVLAAHNTLRLDRARAQGELCEQALDMLTAAVFAVDAQGHLTFANAAAEATLRSGEWLCQIAGHLVPARVSIGGRDCRAALDRLRVGLASVVRLESTNGRQAVLHVIPVRGADLPAAAWGSSSALIWLVPLQADASPVERTVHVIGLTAAEGRLLGCLAGGEELRDAAAHLGISVHTARNQLKSIFRKSGRRTQAELLSLVARLGVLKV